MIITLVGWNCKKNLGDDVMTDVIIDNFSKTYPKAHFKIIGEQSSLPVFQASLNHPGITIKAIKHYDFFNSIKGFKFFFNRFFIAPLIALNSDIVIIGGGTIYHSVALTKFYEFVLGVKKIFNPKCKVYSTGVSIGPFKTHEELEVFTEFSSKVDFFSVRDKRSKDLLNNNQRSILAPDLALAYTLTKAIDEVKQNTIGIILRQGHVNEKTSFFLKDLIIDVNKRYPSFVIKFFSFCEYYLPSENDTLAITDFVKKHNLESFPIQIIKYNNDPHEYCKLLAQSKLLISIRLHGAILGYALKTPFFMISYHEKCIDFFNELSLDKRYLVDVDKHAELYVDEIGKILNNESNFEFDDQYGHLSLDHFKING